MIKIEFQANNFNVAVPDGGAQAWAEDVAQKGNGYYITSNHLCIYHIRLLVQQGTINHNNVEFIFEDRVISVNKNGRLNHWPKGFCDHIDNVLCELA